MLQNEEREQNRRVLLPVFLCLGQNRNEFARKWYNQFMESKPKKE